MNGSEYPRVSAITYRCKVGDCLDFSADEGYEFESGAFRGRFAQNGERLRCELLEHFSTPDQARKVVEAILRSWELDVALRHRMLPEHGLQFEYIGAEILRFNPDQQACTEYVMAAQPGYLSVEGSVSVLKVEPRNPRPPDDFEATPIVNLLTQRYIRHLHDKEQLPSFARYVYTAVCTEFGGQPKNAAAALRVSRKILDRLGTLSGWKGDAMAARKFAEDREFHPLTSGEVRWLRDVTPLLIRRLGEHAAGKDLDYLTNEDLPDILAD